VLAPSTFVTGPPGSAAIAAGSVATARAGAAVLRQGGNAIDAIVGAAFAAAVSEPGLSSLGGGGFCLHRRPQGVVELLDFFVDAPGIDRSPELPVDIETITVQFPQTTQVFHVGWGSVAVPGSFSGYLQLHGMHGRLPLAQVVQPAMAMARDGVVVEPVTALDLTLVGGALGFSSESRALVFEGDRPKVVGEMLSNPAYAELLHRLSNGSLTGPRDLAYLEPMAQAMQRNNGMVTMSDVLRYEAINREPLVMERRGNVIYTNPPPSFGGSIALGALADLPVGSAWPEVVEALNTHTIRQRNDPARRSRGTTHVSVIDGDGYVAAMTMSIGTGSGVVVPGWGVQLNNMAGEEDLNPAGLHSLEPGTRMGSMMAPTLLVNSDGSVTGFGTGGSERIRSTTTSMIIRLIDEQRTLLDAVNAPRIHPAPDGTVQCEPGLPSQVVADLERIYQLNKWHSHDFYFGGVHAVQRQPDGSVAAVGDGRRGGHVEIVFPEEMSHGDA
jgi:gamma-glutamyltranspeptidase / glutathione hydrolase